MKTEKEKKEKTDRLGIGINKHPLLRSFIAIEKRLRDEKGHKSFHLIMAKWHAMTSDTGEGVTHQRGESPEKTDQHAIIPSKRNGTRHCGNNGGPQQRVASPEYWNHEAKNKLTL